MSYLIRCIIALNLFKCTPKSNLLNKIVVCSFTKTTKLPFTKIIRNVWNGKFKSQSLAIISSAVSQVTNAHNIRLHKYKQLLTEMSSNFRLEEGEGAA